MPISNGTESEFEALKVSNPQTDTASDFVTTTGTDGTQGKISGENISINPPTPVNYMPTSANIKGHLGGIDNKLGTIVATTAGVTTRVWFTADVTVVSATNYYATGATKGTASSAIQTVNNDDNQKKYYTQDVIGAPFATATIFPVGVYAGNLSASTTPNSAQQRWTVEIYKCNNLGVPIASGITGAPVGDLGVTVVTILDSGLLTLADGSVTNVQVSGNLASPLSVAVGERIRYHVSAEKVGTVGNFIAQSIYYGTSYNSYLDVPVPLNTTAVQNLSGVTGSTTTDALNELNSKISEREKTIYSTKFATVSDLSVSGAFTIVATGLKSPASGTFGSTYAVWLKQTVIDKDVTRAIVTITNASSVFGLIRKPSVAVEAGTKASINGSTNTITIYNGWDGSNTNPGVSVSATIPFSLVSGKQYLLELEKVSAGTKTFTITDISNQETFSITSNNEVNTFSGSCWDAPGVSFESGDVTFNYLSFGSLYNQKPLVMISGDSFVEGNSLVDFGLGAYDKRWDYLIYSSLQNDAVLSGRGGESSAGLLLRNDIDFFKPKYHLFLIGANDTVFATWQANYDAFIAKILASGAIPVLATIAPRADRQAFINQANAYIKTLPYKVINFAKTISLNNDEVTVNPAYYLADNVHPNIAGHLAMYNQVKIDFPSLFDKDYELHDAVVKGTLTLPSLAAPGFRTMVIDESGIIQSVESGITGSGTVNFIPKYIGTTTIYNSQFYDDGTNTGVGTPSPISKFNIDKPSQAYNSSTPTAGLVISDAVVGGTQRGVELGTDTDNGVGYLQARSVLGATWYDIAINPNGGNVKIGNLSGTGTRTVVADASGNLSATSAAPTSGTYTPTLAAVSNITGFLTTPTYEWTRVGDIVFVSGSVAVTATASSTNCNFTVTLPVNRALTSTYNIGHGSSTQITSGDTQGSVFIQSLTTSTANISFYSRVTGSSISAVYSFAYDVTK